MQDFDGFFHGFHSFCNGLSLFGDVLGLAEGVSDVLVFVDLRVQLELEFLLGHLDQEISYSFWHCVSHVSDNDSEVSVNSRSDLLNESVGAFLGRTSLLLLLSRLSVAVVAAVQVLLVVIVL